MAVHFRRLRCALLLLLAIWSGAAAAFAQAKFDSLLAREDLWTLDQSSFQHAAAELPFGWTSQARDSARAARPQMTLFGLPVVEVIVRFQADKVSEITAFFFARGDAGELPRERFEAVVRASTDAVSAFTGTKFSVRGKDPANVVKAEGLLWQTERARFLLEYSFTRKMRDTPFRAEFVRLEITPPAKETRLVPMITGAVRPRFSGPANVKRDPASGDVLIANVPMIDQGDRGYCVSASAERVLRYYGTQVDTNELAQISNSDAERGTDLYAMLAALKKVSTRLRVKVRTIDEFSIRELLTMVKDYNRAAKKAGAPELLMSGQVIDLQALYAQMKPELLKEVRLKEKVQFARFQRAVQTQIDSGIPLLWTVMLGLVKEAAIPQAEGGHMRLIIGYNLKNQEVLYSDSWGAGHELKRMSFEDAFTISSGVISVEPT
jgi:hypothetical protein